MCSISHVGDSIPVLHTCPAISTPHWQLPGFLEAPGSWLLLAVIVVIAVVAAPRLLAPLASWRSRFAVALTYALAILLLVLAVGLLALVLPVYQIAAALQLLYFQSGASQAATDCAKEFLRVVQQGGTTVVQFSILSLALALACGAFCVWLRSRSRRRAKPAH